HGAVHYRRAGGGRLRAVHIARALVAGRSARHDLPGRVRAGAQAALSALGAGDRRGRRKRSDAARRVLDDRAGRLFAHRPRGRAAAHGLERLRVGRADPADGCLHPQHQGSVEYAQAGPAMSFVCAIPLVASLFAGCLPPEPVAVGYVEGEYVLLAPLENAQVRSVSVRRGDAVTVGQVLATVEGADAEIAVAQSEAALAQAKAQLADLKQGKRPEEIAVLEAALRSAEAQAAEARRVMTRTEELKQKGIATQADLDKAATSLEIAEAAVGKARADLEVAK